MDIDTVVAAIMMAAADPSRWDWAMDVMSGATGSFAAIIFPIPLGGAGLIAHSAAISTALAASIRDGWIERDQRYGRASPNRKYDVVAEPDIATEELLARTAHRRELLTPPDLRWFAGVRIAAGNLKFALSLQRTGDQGPFSAAEVAQLKALAEKLGGGAAIIDSLVGARVEAALLAFEFSGAAVALLDGSGHAIRLNKSAESLLGADISLRRGRFVSRNVKATLELDGALHAIVHGANMVARPPPVQLPRAGRRPVLAYPARLSKAMANVLGLAHGLIVLVDLDTRRRAPEIALRAAFGLTETESRLAAKLAEGATIQDCAEAMNVTYETSRNHLKAIFAKTDTHRQAELVALCARLPPNEER
jgi:DNA-binding CsgD family transcriptional regulator